MPVAMSVQEPEQFVPQRTWAMWAAVIAIMAFVLIGWVTLLRSNLSSDGSSSSLFRGVFDRVKGVFTGDGVQKNGARPTTIEADEAKLQELRDEVFPQFRNVNE